MLRSTGKCLSSFARGAHNQGQSLHDVSEGPWQRAATSRSMRGASKMPRSALDFPISNPARLLFFSVTCILCFFLCLASFVSPSAVALRLSTASAVPQFLLPGNAQPIFLDPGHLLQTLHNTSALQHLQHSTVVNVSSAIAPSGTGPGAVDSNHHRRPERTLPLL